MESSRVWTFGGHSGAMNVAQLVGKAGELGFDGFNSSELLVGRFKMPRNLGHMSFDQTNAFDIAARGDAFNSSVELPFKLIEALTKSKERLIVVDVFNLRFNMV